MEGADMPDLLGGPQSNSGNIIGKRKVLNIWRVLLVGVVALYIFLGLVKLGINYFTSNDSLIDLLFDSSLIANFLFPLAIVVLLLIKNKHAALLAIAFGALKFASSFLYYWFSDSWTDFLMAISYAGSQLLGLIYFMQFISAILISILGFLVIRKERRDYFEKN